jgi:uncharacterized protein YukE
MSWFQVEPESLGTAAGSVKSSISDLAGARQAVNGTAGAASGTPAASAYETLIADARAQLETLQTAVEELSQALNKAAGNYTGSDNSAAASFGGPMRAR